MPPQFVIFKELEKLKLSDLHDFMNHERRRTPDQLLPILPEKQRSQDGTMHIVLPGDHRHSMTRNAADPQGNPKWNALELVGSGIGNGYKLLTK